MLHNQYRKGEISKISLPQDEKSKATKILDEVIMERIKSLGVEQRAAVIILTITAICSIGLLLANCAVV